MSFTPPTIGQFQAQFPRDWPYGSGLDKVTNQDIQNAINEGQGLFNPDLWDNSTPLPASGLTGSIVQGSMVIQGLASTSGIFPGMQVSGSGIPGGATVTFVGGTTIQISAAATQTLNFVALNFSLAITGNTQLGSNMVTGLSSVAGLAAGQLISGAGIPAGAQIQLVGTSSIQISGAATANGSGIALTVVPGSGYTVTEATIAYSYLTAHLLVLSLQNAGGLGAPSPGQGAASSGGGIVQSKAVGQVSLQYALPPTVLNSPALAQYLRTGYGQKYLQMLAPKLPGRRVMVVAGERTI